MPDYSMCKGVGCEKKRECRRHMAEPTPGSQAWIKPDPKTCPFFWAKSTRKKEIVNEIFDRLGAKK